jgi:methyl-accepting chemotaxis protein
MTMQERMCTISRSLRIGTRLAIAFIVVTVVFASALVWTVRTHLGIMARSEERAAHGEVLMQQFGALYAAGLQTGQATRNILLNPSDTKAKANFDAAGKEIEAGLAIVADVLSRFEPDSTEKIRRVDALLALWMTDLALQKEAQQLAVDGKPADAVQLINKKETALWRDIKKQVFVLREIQQQVMKEDLAAMRAKTGTETTVMVVVGIVALLAVGAIGMLITRSITRPLAELKDVALRVSKGSVNVPPSQRSSDEIGDLRGSFHELVGAIRQQSEVMEQVAAGRFDTHVDVRSEDDVLNRSIQRVQSSLIALQRETVLLSGAAVEGKLANRGDAARFQGGYREIVQGVNATLDAVIGPLNVAAVYVDRIAKGDIPPKITDNYTGDFNTIRNNLNLAIDAVNALVADTNMLSQAAVEGKLATRADATKHGGDFRKIVQGVNDTLDAVIGPLNVAAGYVDRISKGDIPERITDSYNGDFNAIKDNLNVCIDTLNGLLSAREEMSRQHEQGMIDYVIDEWEFSGAYREMAHGINTLVLSHIDVTMQIVDVVGKYAAGDLSVDMVRLPGRTAMITEAIDGVKQNILALHAEIMNLVEAAKAGRLGERGNTERFAFHFSEMVRGINDMMDAVIRPVQEGSNALAIMASGDLTARMTGTYHGDLLLLKESINKVGGSLEDALRNVGEAVSATANASREISSSTEQMAAGAQEQTSQAGEVASAVEEMTSTITENSKNASVAAETAKQARVSAEQGGRVVGETVDGMRRIAEVVNRGAATVKELGRSSDQIGEIIGVIEDIANQTNLLALNAAIEAARAGEQGRGFAVVADEVRKLAERTTRATKEISGMIKKIQSDTTGAVRSMEEGTSEVERGIGLADKAGASLQDIVGVSQKVTDMVTQIAAASEEQSASSEQISKNVAAIRQVTGETAQGTQHIASAAEELNRLTDNLQRLIGRFKVGSGVSTTRTIAARGSGVLVET